METAFWKQKEDKQAKMKNLRVSPLNIATAAIVFWFGAALLNKSVSFSTAVWIAVLIIVVVVVDQFFRMMVGNLTRIWLVETIFIVLVLVVIWLLRNPFN